MVGVSQNENTRATRGSKKSDSLISDKTPVLIKHIFDQIKGSIKSKNGSRTL